MLTQLNTKKHFLLLHMQQTQRAVFDSVACNDKGFGNIKSYHTQVNEAIDKQICRKTMLKSC